MKKLGEILVDAQVINESQISWALSQKLAKGERIGELLVRLGLISEDVLLKALAKQMRLPILDLNQLNIPERLLKIFPKEMMLQYAIIPVALKGLSGKETLIVAIADPANVSLVRTLEQHTPYVLRLGLSTEKLIRAALKRYESVLVEKNLWVPNPAATKPAVLQKSVPAFDADDHEVTAFTVKRRDVFDASGGEADILYALSEPTHPGVSLGELNAEASQSSAQKAVITTPPGVFPKIKEAPKVVLDESTLPVVETLEDLMRTTDKNLVLQAVIQLLIERKLFSLRELIERLELKKK